MKALLGIVGGLVLTLAVFASGLAFATWLLTAKPVRQITPAIGVSELWTEDARPVDPSKQGLERIPAAGAPAKPDETAKADTGTPAASLGTLTQPEAEYAPTRQTPQTGTALGQRAPDVASAEQPAQQASAELPAAHLEWCANRYRSYRPEENSYRSYSGEMRSCISPYFDPDRPASTGVHQTDKAGMADQVATADDQTDAQGFSSSLDGYATTYGGPEQPEDQAPAVQAVGAVSQASADHIDYCFSRYRSYDPQDNTYQPYDGGPRRQCE